MVANWLHLRCVSLWRWLHRRFLACCHNLKRAIKKPCLWYRWPSYSSTKNWSIRVSTWPHDKIGLLLENKKRSNFYQSLSRQKVYVRAVSLNPKDPMESEILWESCLVKYHQIQRIWWNGKHGIGTIDELLEKVEWLVAKRKGMICHCSSILPLELSSLLTEWFGFNKKDFVPARALHHC